MVCAGFFNFSRELCLASNAVYFFGWFSYLSGVNQVPAEPRTFVLEIGTEELPPHDVVNACKQVNTLDFVVVDFEI